MNWLDRKKMIKSTFVEFGQERSLMHGAALAYYAMLALVPILYLTVTFVGKLVGEAVVIEEIGFMLRDNVGLKDPSGILAFLKEVDFLSGSWLVETMGVIALMFSCTVIFNSLKGSINEFYDIGHSKKEKKNLLISTVLSRLISLGFIIGITLFFIILYFAEPILLSLVNKLFKGVEVLDFLFSFILSHVAPHFDKHVHFQLYF